MLSKIRLITLKTKMVVIHIFKDKKEMAVAAAQKASLILQDAISRNNIVRFIAATGASQFEFLEELCKTDEIDWNKTEMFHLDEYIGLPVTHPASFRKFLTERIVSRVKPGKVHFIKAETDEPIQECIRINLIISRMEIDVAFIGIGENGHIAFNDPPADFDAKDPYIIVNLTESCKKQQVGEGWFKSIDDVPSQAISMSINEIMRVKEIICICSDKRKALAVKECLSEEALITPLHPASILKKHDSVHIYLDENSASLL